MRHLFHRAAVLVLACTAFTERARAHESPAMPPQFVPADCITVVDLAEQSALDIAYDVAADDTVLEQGDIAVEDAKTHQFFAFRGMVFPQGFNHELRSFDAAMPEPVLLPIWITRDDVKRAATANELAPAAIFSEADVPDDAVLDNNAQLAGRWLRITADDARAPITVERAQQGARWELSSVEPGLYTIVAYIFSPPYNGWAPREGLVKVVDGESDLPAAVIEPLHELLFSYQGKRVRACVHAPEGTMLSALVAVQERPEHGWLPWLPLRAAPDGPLELCFNHPRPELTGTVRLRFDLQSPAGTTTTVYSPDTITALAGDGQCIATEAICCDGTEGAEPPACPDAAGTSCEPRADAGGIRDASDAPDAGTEAAAPPRRDERDGSGGCAVLAPRRTPASPRAVLVLLLVCLSRSGRLRAARARCMMQSRLGRAPSSRGCVR
jgi:hypothetical protein